MPVDKEDLPGTLKRSPKKVQKTYEETLGAGPGDREAPVSRPGVRLGLRLAAQEHPRPRPCPAVRRRPEPADRAYADEVLPKLTAPTSRPPA
jgi:hypothetical protein